MLGVLFGRGKRESCSALGMSTGLGTPGLSGSSEAPDAQVCDIALSFSSLRRGRSPMFSGGLRLASDEGPSVVRLWVGEVWRYECGRLCGAAAINAGKSIRDRRRSI